MDRSLDRRGQQVDLVETPFVFVIVFVVDPTVVLIELVKLPDAFIENFGIQEVFQYDMGVRAG